MTEEQGQRKQASKKAKISAEAMEQALSSQRSFWPFVLAIALCVVALGVIVQPVIFFIGLALAVIAVIGWGLEHH